MQLVVVVVVVALLATKLLEEVVVVDQLDFLVSDLNLAIFVATILSILDLKFGL
jgi:hypothetical protein